MDETREQKDNTIPHAGPKIQFLKLKNLVFGILWEQAQLIGRIPVSDPLRLELARLRLISRRIDTRLG